MKELSEAPFKCNYHGCGWEGRAPGQPTRDGSSDGVWVCQVPCGCATCWNASVS